MENPLFLPVLHQGRAGSGNADSGMEFFPAAETA
jgi:hypothetical protein